MIARLFLLLCCNPAALSIGVVQTRPLPGDGVAELRIERTALSLADELQATVSVTGPAPVQVEAIPFLTSSPGWTTRPTTDPTITPLPGRRARWQQVYHLTPQWPGTLTLQPTPLRCSLGPDGDQLDPIHWDPVTIQVTTVVKVVDLASVRDVVDIDRQPPLPPSRWLRTSGLILLTSGLGLAIGRLLLRRRRVPPALAPTDWLRRELDQLEKSNALDQRTFHRHLADLVRDYLSRQFNVPAPLRTSAELLAHLEQADLDSADCSLLRDFLARCDQAKYAPPTPAAIDTSALTMARQLLASSAGLNDRETSRKTP